LGPRLLLEWVQRPAWATFRKRGHSVRPQEAWRTSNPEPRNAFLFWEIVCKKFAKAFSSGIPNRKFTKTLQFGRRWKCNCAA
jgi:hypothetical protein